MRARRDQKDPKPLTQIPAQTAYLNLTEKHPVRQDWVVADAVWRNRSPRPVPKLPSIKKQFTAYKKGRLAN